MWNELTPLETAAIFGGHTWIPGCICLPPEPPPDFDPESRYQM